MKKFLGIIVLAGALVACNDTSDSTTNPDSTTTTPIDTTVVTPLDTTVVTPLDTTKVGDTTRK